MTKDKVRLVKYTKFNLTTTVNGEECSLVWSTRMGYPRINVFIGAKEDHTNYDKMIVAPFDYVSFQMFIGRFKKALNKSFTGKEEMEFFNAEWKDGVKTGDIALQSKVMIGKREDGIIYLTVIEGVKNITFDMLPDPRWYKHYDNNGLLFTQAELSSMFARAYIVSLEKCVEYDMIHDSRVELEIDSPDVKRKKLAESDSLQANPKSNKE